MKKPKQYKRRVFKSGKKYVSNKRNARKYGYDKFWDKYRFRFLHYNPNCYCCPSPSRVVDHAVAHKGDEKLFKNLKNHLPMCTKCHNTVTGKFDRVNPPLVKEKSDWMIEKRRINNITVKVVVLDLYDATERKR